MKDKVPKAKKAVKKMEKMEKKPSMGEALGKHMAAHQSVLSKSMYHKKKG